MKRNTTLTRKSFMRSALAAGAFPFLPACVAPGRKWAPNELVRVACCGVSGMGGNDLNFLARTGLCEITAICDTDLGNPKTLPNMKKYPKAARYHDFRKMFDEMADDIDAVSVGVPDHSHFPIIMRAIKEGKAVYTEKPMGHTFNEIQIMIEAERKYGVVCQMGNQGHSRESMFQMRDYVKKGIIDPNSVSRIVTHMTLARRWHKWNGKVNSFPAAMPLPSTMSAHDWDTWIGTCPWREHSTDFTYGEWRSWFDFGNGCLGDWGAHVFDGIHRFFALGLPNRVEIRDVKGWNPYVFPMQNTLVFKFPAKEGRRALDIEWYEGTGNRPARPKGFVYKGWEGNIPKSGSQSYADEGKIELRPGKEIYMSDGTVWQGCSHEDPLFRVGAAVDDVPEYQKPVEDHWTNFLRAVKGETRPNSPFSVAGELSQVFCLGCIAQKLNRSIDFDPVKREVRGDSEANALLNGPAGTPRPGWEEYYKI